MEIPGIEPGAFHMQSERATTALHPRSIKIYEIEISKTYAKKYAHLSNKYSQG